MTAGFVAGENEPGIEPASHWAARVRAGTRASAGRPWGAAGRRAWGARARVRCCLGPVFAQGRRGLGYWQSPVGQRDVTSSLGLEELRTPLHLRSRVQDTSLFLQEVLQVKRPAPRRERPRRRHQEAVRSSLGAEAVGFGLLLSPTGGAS